MYAATGLSFEEFLKQFAEVHAEYIMGNVEIMSNNVRHQFILHLLSLILGLYLSMKPLGRLLLAGVPMDVGDDVPKREPDLMIVFNENLSRIQATFVAGPADIVVEIVSPESNDRDYGPKFREYEAAGVREYWRIDPLREETDVFALEASGRYRRLKDPAGRMVSRLLPGFVLDPALLWREQLPDGHELINLVQEMTA